MAQRKPEDKLVAAARLAKEEDKTYGKYMSDLLAKDMWKDGKVKDKELIRKEQEEDEGIH